MKTVTWHQVISSTSPHLISWKIFYHYQMNFTITNYTDNVKHKCVGWKEWKICNKQFSKGPEVCVAFRKNKIIWNSEKLMRIKNWNKLNYSCKKSKWFFFYESKTVWWTVNHSMTLMAGAKRRKPLVNNIKKTEQVTRKCMKGFYKSPIQFFSQSLNNNLFFSILLSFAF